jgi:hypothetical protein
MPTPARESVILLVVMILLSVMLQMYMMRPECIRCRRREGFVFDTSPGARNDARPDGDLDMSQYVLKTEIPQICESYNRNRPNAPFPSIAQLVRRAEMAEATDRYPAGL